MKGLFFLLGIVIGLIFYFIREKMQPRYFLSEWKCKLFKDYFNIYLIDRYSSNNIKVSVEYILYHNMYYPKFIGKVKYINDSGEFINVLNIMSIPEGSLQSFNPYDFNLECNNYDVASFLRPMSGEDLKIRKKFHELYEGYEFRIIKESELLDEEFKSWDLAYLQINTINLLAAQIGDIDISVYIDELLDNVSIINDYIRKSTDVSFISKFSSKYLVFLGDVVNLLKDFKNKKDTDMLDVKTEMKLEIKLESWINQSSEDLKNLK